MANVEMVPVGPLAAALSATRLSRQEIAFECGYKRKAKSGDTRQIGDESALLRRLGLKPEIKEGRRWCKTHVSYDVAVRIARALDVDPVDVGI